MGPSLYLQLPFIPGAAPTSQPDTSKACTGMVLAFRVDGCRGAGGAVELMSCRAFRA